jgi:ubiquinone/menaquinone biosynthesis C-methylase UbiE
MMETMAKTDRTKVVGCGCAFPLEKVELQPGQIVLDLGCGLGSEVLRAARAVGPEGFVYGLDTDHEALELARRIAERERVTNVAFIDACIENIPLADESVDVVFSNCVFNLSDDRERAMAQAYRVLKLGGHLVIADIIELNTGLTTEQQRMIAPLLGCVKGVLSQEGYLRMMAQSGFVNREIEVYQRYTTDRLISRAMKRQAFTAQAALEEAGFARRVNGAFASVYLTADRPLAQVERSELIGV